MVRTCVRLIAALVFFAVVPNPKREPDPVAEPDGPVAPAPLPVERGPEPAPPPHSQPPWRSQLSPRAAERTGACARELEVGLLTADWERASAAVSELHCTHTACSGDHPQTAYYAAWASDLERVRGLGTTDRADLATAMHEWRAAVRSADRRESARLMTSALGRITRSLPTGSVLELLGRAYRARLLERLSDAAGAESDLREALRIIERIDARHADAGDLHFRLGQILLARNDADAAEEHLRVALVNGALSRNDGAPELNRCQDLYATLIGHLSSPALSRGVTAWRTVLADWSGEHRPRAVTAHYLFASAGSLAIGASQPAAAESWLRTALQSLPGRRGREWVSAYYNLVLGNACENLGRPDDAIECYDRARRALEETAQPDRHASHFTLLWAAQRNVGVAHSAAGRYGAARQAFKGALNAPEVALAPVDVAYLLYHVGWNEYRVGDDAAAEAALDSACCLLGPNGTALLRARFADLRAHLLRRRGALAGAERELRCAAEYLRGTGLEDSADAALIRCHLAGVLSEREQHETAVTEARAAHDRLTQIFGPDHPHTGGAAHEYARTLSARGEYAAALAHAQHAFRVMVLTRGIGHAETLHAGVSVAQLLRELGSTREASRVLRWALAALDSGTDPATRALVHSEYGTLLEITNEPGGHEQHARAVACANGARPLDRARVRLNTLNCLVSRAESGPTGDRAGAHRAAAAEADALLELYGNASEPALRVVGLHARHRRARCHLLAGEWDLAARHLEVVAAAELVTNQWASAVHTELGLAFVGLNRVREAELQFRRAVELADGLASGYGRPGLARLDPLSLTSAGGHHAALLAARDPRGAFVALERARAHNLRAVVSDAPAPLELARVQQSLPADAAFVTWVDGPRNAPGFGFRWACVLRRAGGPVWVRLRGSGPNGTWADDDACEERYRQALARGARTAGSESRSLDTLRERVHERRVAPLLPHFAARDGLPPVRHLIVALAGPLADIPVETLTDQFVVSYAHSADTFARVRVRSGLPRNPTLLAFGPPDYEARVPPVPPASGVVLAWVLPALARTTDLRAGDVVRAYAGVPTADAAALSGALRGAAATGRPRVAVTVWRDGREFDVESPLWAGEVGFARGTPREALAAHQLHGPDPDAPARLPWCENALAAWQATYDPDGAGRATVHAGAGATLERVRAERAPGGRWATADVIAFAVHGRRNDAHPLATALLLPQGGGARGIGELTAGDQVGWGTRAGLVISAACGSGGGKWTPADGRLGYTQVYLSNGAAACLVSLWDVDDQATAFLLTRFHQNLCGRRPGLRAPLAPAEALHEAKQWLRGLTVSEVIAIGKVLKTDPRALVSRPDSDARPVNELRSFADPRFWAGFVLVGRPD